MIIFMFVWIFRNIWFGPFTILSFIVDSWIWKSSLTSCGFSRVQSSILVDSSLARSLFISRHCHSVSSHSIYPRMTRVSWRILGCTVWRLKSFIAWILWLYAVTTAFYRLFTFYWWWSHHIANLISSHSVLIA